MTRDDVIRLAQQANPEWLVPDPEMCSDEVDDLERFAALVRAQVIEEAAKVCDEMREHWCAYKDTAQLNGDIELSIAASGEPRAAEALAELIRSRKGGHEAGCAGTLFDAATVRRCAQVCRELFNLSHGELARLHAAKCADAITALLPKEVR